MSLFDRYVVVDWSARSSAATGKDSIWIATLDRHGVTRFSNPATRRVAEDELTTSLDAAASRRTLLAVDASLGYPIGSAEWFGLGGEAPWQSMWATLEREIADDERNCNNRFAVAAALNGRRGPPLFWGRPAATELDGLSVTKPSAHPVVAEFRACDRFLRARGHRPASPWQLLGAGSVGSQSLTLIPVLERLRRTRWVHVWPFTTGLRPPRVSVGEAVIVEIWPTVFPGESPVHWVRDAAQVFGVARRLAAADRAGELASWFSPPVTEAEHVEREEGWILGVGAGLAIAEADEAG